MDLHELKVAARLIDGLAKRALFAEDLKAARNLTTATAESVIKERDALREDLRREEESHEETAQLLKTVDQKVRLLTQERDALRAQLDTERERHKQTASILAQYAPKTMQIEPPPEATHDTPEGKASAESAVKREPKPGDKVRLVREPSHTDIPAMLPWSKAFGMPGDTAIVVIMAVPDKVPSGTIPVRTGMGRCFFWPISCIEIVEDAK